MPNLQPPPTGVTFDWRVFKDWFFRLWKSVTGLTYGIDATSYSSALAGTTAPGDGTSGFLRINGSSYDPVYTLSPGASPWTWTNILGYDVDFFATAATSITAASYARYGVSITVPFTTTSVMCRVSAGDSITVTYSGALTSKAVSR